MKRVGLALMAYLRARFGRVGARGERLRADLEALGGAWVKFGQMLSLRYDLVPADVCDALRPLQGAMKGEAGTYARDVVTQELGSLDAFRTFSDEPFAAATTSQVHRGDLVDGADACVKVLGRNVEPLYASDLRVMRVAARIINWFRPRYCLPDMAAELTVVLAEELDLRFECAHIVRMTPILRKHGLRVPKVYAHLCTSRMLVTEWIDGKTISDLLAMPTQKRRAWLALAGLGQKRVAKTYLRSLYRQVMECNRFHGDMHPANLIITANGQLYVVDFGTTSATALGFLEIFSAFLKALYLRDHEKAADLYCILCITPPAHCLTRGWRWVFGDWQHAELRRDLVRVMSTWAARAEIKTLPFAVKSVNRLSNDMLTVIHKFGGAVQWGWLRITRAFMTIEVTIQGFWPELNYIKEMRLYLKAAARRERLKPFTLVGLANSVIVLADWMKEFVTLESMSRRGEAIAAGGL